MFTFQWDENTKRILANFQNARSYLSTFIYTLTNDLGEKATDFIHEGEFLHAKAVWDGSTHGTGELDASLAYSIEKFSNGFRVNFSSLFYGVYMDVGNFPPGAVIARKNGKGFPVGLRGTHDFSQVTWSQTIHGMGYRTPGVPTHFSEKTVDYLAEHVHEFVDSYIEELFEKMVS